MIRCLQLWGASGERYVLSHAASGSIDARHEPVRGVEAAWVIHEAMHDARSRDRIVEFWADLSGTMTSREHHPIAMADRIVDELRRPAGLLTLHRAQRVRHPITAKPAEPSAWLHELDDDAPIQPPREEPPEPEPALHWIELQVVHENGVPFAELMVEVELPDGSRRVENLDASARIRIGDLPNPATCRVRFPDGVHLPRWAERPKATPISAKAGDRLVPALEASGVGVVLAIDEAHRIVVQRPIVSIVQMSEIQFGLARAIVLPESPVAKSEESSDAGPEETPLSAIASALGFAAMGERPKSVLVAGHTDTTGSDDSNLVLSQARADNVQLLMAGDRAAWAEHCQGHYAVDDVQRILKWAAREQGWPCDPGAIDNDLGKQTRGALKAFRQAYNHDMAGTLDPEASVGPRDWEAFADLYDLAIAQRLSALGHIADIREAVRWAEPAALGCGEEWPVENTALDEYISQSNRRVDILFFDDVELPDLGASPPGVDVYGSDRYRAEPVPIEPWEPGQSLEYELWVELHDLWDDEVIAGRDYRIVGPLPARTHERRGTTDGEGTLREQELPWGDYWVEVDGAGVFCGTRYMGHDPNDHADVHCVPGLGRSEVPARPERPQPKWEVPVTGIDELAHLADIFDPFAAEDAEGLGSGEERQDDDEPLADVG